MAVLSESALEPAAAPAPRLRHLLREVAFVAALFGLYNLGRLIAGQRVSGAFDNALALWELERWLNLPSERTLQQVVLAVPEAVQLANSYYAAMHFPLTFGVLLWLFLRRPTSYLWARRSLVVATAAGLVVQLALPTAPPRMLTELGFVDTGAHFGQSVYGPVGQDSLANQFAAMPSLHVGWALLVAVICIRTGRTRWRWLWIAHPLMTVAVVVVTGHHFWVDGVAGGVLVVGALLAMSGVSGGRDRLQHVETGSPPGR